MAVIGDSVLFEIAEAPVAVEGDGLVRGDVGGGRADPQFRGAGPPEKLDRERIVPAKAIAFRLLMATNGISDLSLQFPAVVHRSSHHPACFVIADESLCFRIPLELSPQPRRDIGDQA